MSSKVLEEIVLVNDNFIGTEAGDNSGVDSTSRGVGIRVRKTTFNLFKVVELFAFDVSERWAIASSICDGDVSCLQDSEHEFRASYIRSTKLGEAGRDFHSLVRKLREVEFARNINHTGIIGRIEISERAGSEQAFGRDASGNSVLDERGRVPQVGSPPGAVILSGSDNSRGSGSVGLVTEGSMAVGGSGMAVSGGSVAVRAWDDLDLARGVAVG